VKHSWRRFGLLGLAVTVVALGADAWRRRPYAAEALPAPAPGFVQRVDEHLGTVEISVEGPVELRESRADFRAGDSTLQVDGRDPEPVGGDGMALTDVRIVRANADGTVVYEALSPRGEIKLVPGATRLAVDRTRPWPLHDPTLRLPGVLGGREMTLVAERALLDPESGGVRTEGAFSLSGAGLHLEGFDLALEPGGRLRWGETQGATIWRMRTPGGNAFEGRSDGGGTLQPMAPDLQVLELPAKSWSEVVMPAHSGTPGTLRTRGLRLELDAAEDTWTPRSARGLDATIFESEDGALRASGAGSVATWGADGTIAAIDIDGPALVGRRGLDGSLWGHARGGAWIGPAGQEIYLHGGVLAFAPEGRMRANWLRQTPAGRSAGGTVWLEGPDGTLRAGRVEPRKPDGYWLEDGVIAWPTDPGVRAITAGRAELQADGPMRLFDGFQVWGSDAGEDWQLQGLQLESDGMRRDSRIGADGRVSWQRGPVSVQGEKLIRRSDTEIVVRGRPAVARMPMGAAGADKTGAAPGLLRVSAERFTWTDEGLLVQGSPVLELPAAQYGLKGDVVEVRCDSLTWDEASGVWQLNRQVRFDGALRGAARQGRWHPDDGLTLLGRVEIPWLEGEELGGRGFRLEGREVRLRDDGEVRLDEDAAVELKEPGAVRATRMEGDAIEFHADGGWVDGGTRILGPAREGAARRIEWQSTSTGARVIRLLGDAWLRTPDGEARGERVLYDPGDPDEGRDPSLELVRSDKDLARLTLPDGSVATGDRLHLNLLYRLLSGENIRATRPPK